MSEYIKYEWNSYDNEFDVNNEKGEYITCLDVNEAEEELNSYYKRVKALERKLEETIDLAESAITTADGMGANTSYLSEWLEQLKEQGE